MPPVGKPLSRHRVSPGARGSGETSSSEAHKSGSPATPRGSAGHVGRGSKLLIFIATVTLLFVYGLFMLHVDWISPSYSLIFSHHSAPAKHFVKSSQKKLASNVTKLLQTSNHTKTMYSGLGLSDIARKVATVGTDGRKRLALTFSSWAYKPFLTNWLRHAAKANVQEVIVGAMDMETLDYCISEGVPALFMNMTAIMKELIDIDVPRFMLEDASLGDGKDFRGDYKRFHRMGGEKVAMLLALVSAGYNILLSDADTVWLRNPFAYLESTPEADVQISTDCVSVYADRIHIPVTATFQDLVANGNALNETIRSYTGAELDPRSRCGHHAGLRSELSANTGVVYFRANSATLEFIQEWLKTILTSNQKVYDQEAFNRVAHRQVYPITPVATRRAAEAAQEHPMAGRIIFAFDRQLKLGILPVSHFSNGHIYFVQKRPQQLGIVPFSVHPTFQLQEAAGKIMRFREAQIWLADDESYYDGSRNFLSYDVHIPRTLLDAPPSIENHVKIASLHLQMLRTAFAVGAVLNRTVILPKLLCQCDMYWGDSILPWCVTHGAELAFPFECPADNMFSVGYWHWTKFSDFRESTFLTNPQVPSAIRSSIVDVRVVPRGGTETRCGVHHFLRKQSCQTHIPAAGQVLLPTLARSRFDDASATGPTIQSVVVPELAAENELRQLLQAASGARVLHFETMDKLFCQFDTAGDNERFNTAMGGDMLGGIWCCAPGHHLHKPSQDGKDARILFDKPERLGPKLCDTMRAELR